MKIAFTNQSISSDSNRWTVSGYWDTKTSQIHLTRIHGDISSNEGLSEACYALAIEKGWL